MPPMGGQDPTGLMALLGGGGGAQPMAAPPAANPTLPPDGGLPPPEASGMMGPAGMAGMGPDEATQQAVWDEFPGTDPDMLRSVAAQMGGNPLAAIEPLQALFDEDRKKLDALHQQQLHALVEELMRPADDMAMREPAPAVGGEAVGY
jgi:hypothetical protein